MAEFRLGFEEEEEKYRSECEILEKKLEEDLASFDFDDFAGKGRVLDQYDANKESARVRFVERLKERMSVLRYGR